MAASKLLCAGHAAFDERFTELVACAYRGDWPGLEARWAEFADDVASHFDYEEREIFGDYADEAAEHAGPAAELFADHAALREILGRIAQEVAARHVRAKTVEMFVTRLRAHSEREDATIYAWLEQRRGTQLRRDRAPT